VVAATAATAVKLTPEERARRNAFEAAVRHSLRQRAALLQQVQAGVLEQLASLSATIVALLAEQPADWQQWQLSTILGQVQALVDGLQGQVSDEVDAALVQAWQAGAAGIDAPLAAADINVQIYLPQLDTGVLMQLRSFTAGRIKDLAAGAESAVDQAIHLAALGAQTPQQAMKQVKTALGGDDTVAGVRARRIVVTSLGEAYAVANQQRLVDSKAQVPDLGKQWRRSGKIHSRWNHDAMDGATAPAGEPFKVPTKGAGRFVLMMHPHDPKAPPAEIINCGCVARPWLSRWGLPAGSTPFTQREVELNPMKAAGKGWLRGAAAG
jgi:hypothetical protein